MPAQTIEFKLEGRIYSNKVHVDMRELPGKVISATVIKTKVKGGDSFKASAAPVPNSNVVKVQLQVLGKDGDLFKAVITVNAIYMQ